MTTYDLIVIGGGVCGAALARELSRCRLKILLLEKEAELAFGVSKSNSGIIHPGTQNPPNSLKGKLCVQGNALMRSLAKDLGVHFEEVGELIVIFNDAERLTLKKIKDEAKQLGVSGLKIVERDWLRRNEPNLNPEALAALYAPTAGIISPYRLVYALAENAAKNGIEIKTEHKVINLARENNLFRVETNKGAFAARYLINAAGLYADEIANMLGIQDFEIKPRKGEEFILDKKKENLSRHLLFPLPTPVSKGILIIKTADGNPMLGPTAQETQDKEDLSTSAAGLREVLAGAKKLIPNLSDQDIIAYFAGLRPAAGPDFIIRAEKKVPGLITVAGIQSPGLTAAPAIAQMVKGLLKEAGLELKKKIIFHKHRPHSVHLFEIPFSKTKKLIQKEESYGEIVCRCEMVSSKEVRDAIARGAKTLDGIKFRTRAQAGRCHGGFCTLKLIKIMAEEQNIPVTAVNKWGAGSEIVKRERT